MEVRTVDVPVPAEHFRLIKGLERMAQYAKEKEDYDAYNACNIAQARMLGIFIDKIPNKPSSSDGNAYAFHPYCVDKL